MTTAEALKPEPPEANLLSEAIPGNKIGSVLDVLQIFRELDAEIQTPSVMIFLLIAVEGEMTASQLQQRLGMTASTSSRNIASWVRISTRRAEAFLQSRPDPIDSRRKIISLSPAGEAMKQRIIRSLVYPGACNGRDDTT